MWMHIPEARLLSTGSQINVKMNQREDFGGEMAERCGEMKFILEEG